MIDADTNAVALAGLIGLCLLCFGCLISELVAGYCSRTKEEKPYGDWHDTDEVP